MLVAFVIGVDIRLGSTENVQAAVAASTLNSPRDTFFRQHFFNDVATTTSATSTDIKTGVATTTGFIKTAGAKRVNFYFGRGGATSANTGSSRFRVQVTPDGDNWYDFNKLVQNVATSTTPTTLDAVTITAATSTVIVSLDLRTDAFYAARCIVLETTDGEHTCKATAEY